MRLSAALAACAAALLIVAVPSALASTNGHHHPAAKHKHDRHGSAQRPAARAKYARHNRPAHKSAPKPRPVTPPHFVVAPTAPVTPPATRVSNVPSSTTPPAPTSTGTTSSPSPTPPTPPPAAPPIHCDRYASPSGSDSSGNGGISAPYATINKLDAALRPGQTGCLRAGIYGSTSTWVQINSSGTTSSRITIASYPGDWATVRGYVDIEGSYTTLSHLSIDGSNNLYTQHPAGVNCPAPTSQPLTIAGHDDVLEFDDYYQSVASLRGNGIGIGFWGNADNTVIRFNKIHDVGQCQAYDHVIYLSHGNNVQIYDNWLWNDPHGRGVQLYPAPTNAKIFDNVIDHVGEGFVVGNESGDTVSGNQIYNNVVTNTTGLPWEGIPGEGIHDNYGGTPGTGNAFHDNILYNNPGGIGHVTAVQTYANTSANPQLSDPTNHDYQPQPGSPVAAWGLWNGAS